MFSHAAKELLFLHRAHSENKLFLHMNIKQLIITLVQKYYN